MAKIKWKLVGVLAAVILGGIALFVCIFQNKPVKLDEPAEIEIWYAENTMSADFDSYVEQFNSNDGAVAQVTAKTKCFESEIALLDAAKNAIENNGELPDLIMCDVNTCAYLKSNDCLASVETYTQNWGEDDFDKVVAKACTFDGELVCIPVAYENDVLIVNKTLCGDADSIGSFEELCSIANDYYEENKESFFTIIDYSAFFNSAMTQLDEQFKAENPFDYDNDNVRYIYDQLATAAFKRGYTAATENPAVMVADGELACAVVSTSQVIEAEMSGNMNDIELLPVPAMENGNAVYVREITGITILKSDENTEMGASIFLNWFTSEEINGEYAGYSGFFPAIGSAGGEEKGEKPEIFAELEKLADSLEFKSYNANPDYAFNRYDFNSVMDNIMKKSLR